jgi:hypothetical protein
MKHSKAHHALPVNPTSIPDIGQPKSSQKCTTGEPHSLQIIQDYDSNTRLSSNSAASFGIVTGEQVELGAHS